MVTGTGSITGPTHAMAIYLEMFHRFPDRSVRFPVSVIPREISVLRFPERLVWC